MDACKAASCVMVTSGSGAPSGLPDASNQATLAVKFAGRAIVTLPPSLKMDG